MHAHKCTIAQRAHKENTCIRTDGAHVHMFHDHYVYYNLIIIS